jgi:hypothetical protein
MANAIRVIAVVLLALTITASRETATQIDGAVIVQFQRAADAYAFQHRQTERRGAPPAPLVEGAFFTPPVAAAFRDRIRTSGCDLPQTGDSAVPRVNGAIGSTGPLPPCMSAALPILPPELEYRVAGVAMILADAHLHIVVDILHGAFPAKNN